jgi:hypothetical protein
MWVARDNDETFIYEEKPILDGSRWISDGRYFRIPNHIIYDILGEQLSMGFITV